MVAGLKRFRIVAIHPDIDDELIARDFNGTFVVEPVDSDLAPVAAR